MNKRLTKQKKLIISNINERTDHPTANMVASEISKLDKGASIATVYRNLNSLVDEGIIIKIMTTDNTAHFDVDNDEHCHLVCSHCHRIIDINSDDLIYKEKINNLHNFEVNLKNITLYGLCDQCKNA